MAHSGAAPLHSVSSPPAEHSVLLGSLGACRLQSQIVCRSAFSPVQPGTPSSCPGICHFAVARSTTSCSPFPVGTWLQIILSVLFSTQERALFPRLLPIGEETRKQNKNSSKFWEVFLSFCDGEKGWHVALVYCSMGLFPKLCFTKLMLERKDKPLLVNRDPLRDCIAAGCVDMCTSVGLKAKVSFSIASSSASPS